MVYHAIVGYSRHGNGLNGVDKMSTIDKAWFNLKSAVRKADYFGQIQDDNSYQIWRENWRGESLTVNRYQWWFILTIESDKYFDSCTLVAGDIVDENTLANRLERMITDFFEAGRKME